MERGSRVDQEALRAATQVPEFRNRNFMDWARLIEEAREDMPQVEEGRLQMIERLNDIDPELVGTLNALLNGHFQAGHTRGWFEASQQYVDKFLLVRKRVNAFERGQAVIMLLLLGFAAWGWLS